MRKIIHEIRCPGCREYMTRPMSVRVHLSVDGHEFDRLSCVDAEGILQDLYPRIDPDEGLIAKGFHAGSECGFCGGQLEELVDDDEVQELKDWYVRHEATRAIAGPMTKEEALEISGEGHGMAFCGTIFDSDRLAEKTEELFATKTATSEEVENLVAEMESVATAGIVIPHVIQEVMKRAIETIVILSREKVVPEKDVISEDVERLFTFGCWSDCSQVERLLISLHSEIVCASKRERVKHLCQRAIAVITSLSREKVALEQAIAPSPTSRG